MLYHNRILSNYFIVRVQILCRSILRHCPERSNGWPVHCRDYTFAVISRWLTVDLSLSWWYCLSPSVVYIWIKYGIIAALMPVSLQWLSQTTKLSKVVELQLVTNVKVFSLWLPQTVTIFSPAPRTSHDSPMASTSNPNPVSLIFYTRIPNPQDHFI